MANITNPDAIKFVREEVRPLCETIRALKVRMLSAQTQWFAGLNVTIANTADPVVENRLTAEGVPDLTGAQVTNAIAAMIALAEAINDEIISLPCVRAIEVS